MNDDDVKKAVSKLESMTSKLTEALASLPEFAYSQALAFENLPKEIKEKYNRDKWEFNGIRAHELEKFARAVAYTVSYNLSIGRPMNQDMNPFKPGNMAEATLRDEIQKKWEEHCTRFNTKPERHRTTGRILMHDGMPISKGVLQMFAEADARRNGTTVEEEFDKLITSWEDSVENKEV